MLHYFALFKPKYTLQQNELPMFVWCDIAEDVVLPITDMCNQLISEANFTNIFKYADVTPIYKKGDKDSSSNYRPITILHKLSKIFERVLPVSYTHLTLPTIYSV